jgi:hypothetical protein
LVGVVGCLGQKDLKRVLRGENEGWRKEGSFEFKSKFGGGRKVIFGEKL